MKYRVVTYGDYFIIESKGWLSPWFRYSRLHKTLEQAKHELDTMERQLNGKVVYERSF